MNLAGYTVPNPDDGGLEVEKHYVVVGTETLNGIKAQAIPRTPPSGYGSAYTFPRFTIKMVWSDLIQPEYLDVQAGLDEMIESFARVELDGFGFSGREPYIPGVQAAELTPDAIYATIASSALPLYEYVEGSRVVGGVVYGPILFKVTATLLGFDVQYLWDVQ